MSLTCGTGVSARQEKLKMRFALWRFEPETSGLGCACGGASHLGHYVLRDRYPFTEFLYTRKKRPHRRWLQRWRRLPEVEGDGVLLVPEAQDGDDGKRHATAKLLEVVAGLGASCCGGEGWSE